MRISDALAGKIAKQRTLAPTLLPRTRLCATVVLAMAHSDADIEQAVRALKAELGGNWSHVTAFQFMSGRQAMLAAQSGTPQERDGLLLAHKLAEAVCGHVAYFSLGFADLRKIVQSHTEVPAV